MLRTLIFDLLALPLHFTKPNFMAKWRLSWLGTKPSLAMLIKFYRDSDLDYGPHTKLRLLDYQSIKEISETTPFFYQQSVNENSVRDHKLLKASSLKIYPHEVTQVRIVNAQEEFTSQIYHGGPYQGLDAVSLKQIIRKLCFQARQKGLVIEEVEIAHTHPALEVMVTKKKESTFFFNGLSLADKTLAKDIAPFVDYPLRIKAISPVANYSCLY
jgi:hypothetical protein